MKELQLFNTRDGWLTNTDILRALEKAGVADCKILFMHTALSFGNPNPALPKSVLLHELFQIILSLTVPTICVPTFTFSFCNGQDYNVTLSRSKMGVLNEYIRQLDGTMRSVDPLLSVALVGEHTGLVKTIGHHSIGENSTFHKLHACQDVKFLFFGASLSQCFTYLHFIEERESVPYRYNRDFTGKITDGNQVWEDTYTLFVRYNGVEPVTNGVLEEYLLKNNLLQKIGCGDSFISAIDEPIAYNTVVEFLHADNNVFIRHPFKRTEVNEEFHVTDMVAL